MTPSSTPSRATGGAAQRTGCLPGGGAPRRAPGVLAVPDTVLSVAVFVGERSDASSDLVQLYARENGHRSREGVLIRGDEEVAQVVDRAWQREDPGHLDRARAASGRVMLAGGLSPENVRDAIEAIRPWAVDA